MHDVYIYMDGSGLILVFQTEGNEYGSCIMMIVVDTIYKVGTTLYHALIDEFLIGFFLAAYAVVMEKLIPESRIDQVSRGMLRSPYIEIYILPIFIDILGDEGILVLGIHISQIVS